MQDLASEESKTGGSKGVQPLLIKAVGVVIGQCVFGLFGPILFTRLLSWFEINFPGAVVIGVVVGGVIGYGVAAAVLRIRGRQGRPVSPDVGWPAHLGA